MSCASAASSAAHGQGQVSGGLPAPARAQATVRRRTQRNAGWPPSVLTSSTPGKPCTARRGHMLGHNCGGRRTAGPRRCRAAAGPQVAAASRAAPAPATSCRRRPAKATRGPPHGAARVIGSIARGVSELSYTTHSSGQSRVVQLSLFMPCAMEPITGICRRLPWRSVIARPVPQGFVRHVSTHHIAAHE